MDRESKKETDEAGLKDLVRRLDRVDAPEGLTARVMTRIAAERAEKRPGLWPVFARIAVPAMALALFAGVIWFGFSARELPLTAVADPEPRVFIDPAPVDSPSASPEIPNRTAAVSPTPRGDQRERAIPDNRPDPSGGEGSIDRAIRAGNSKAPTVANASPGMIPGFGSGMRIPIGSVLSDLGIEASTEGRRLIVRSLRPNGLGERSGIAAGDVIEAIDDRRVGPNTVFERSVAGRTLTVTRGGKRVVIELK